MLEKFFNSLSKKSDSSDNEAGAEISAAPVAPATSAASAATPPVSFNSPMSSPAMKMPLPSFSGGAAAPVPSKPVDTFGAGRTADISLYKNLLSGLYDGILIFDGKGAVIGSNQRAEQYLGYTSQDLWGLQCEELVVGVNARLLYKLRANAEAGRFTVVNGNCKRKDGSTFPAEIAISRIHLLHDGDFIFTIHNVERRERVKDQREMGTEAIRNAAAGIIVCTQEGVIEFVNPAFLKILNVENDQMVLKRLIGDFCNSYETVHALLNAPSTQGSWFGTMKLTNLKGITCEVLASSALSQERRNGEPRLVLTMMSIPKTIAAED